MDRPGLRQRIRYRFDNVLARSTGATLLWLGAVTALAMVASAFVLWAFRVGLSGSESGSWLEDFWQSLLRVLDTGTMAADVGWGRRVLALVITIFGVLVAGALIGIIASGVESRIARMRRGRSVVLESDHDVILGSSERLPVVIEQLLVATEGEASTIVVLADRDPTELHEEVHGVVADRREKRVVFRSGEPTSRDDLALVRLAEARGVLILSTDDVDDTPAIKTALAVRVESGREDDLPIVVEVNDPASGDRLVSSLGPSVHPLAAGLAVGRMAAFALRRRGLSQVVDRLTDFHGADLHVVSVPGVVGRSFGEVVRTYAEARPLGRMRADGTVEMAPPVATRFDADDRLIVLADDHRSVSMPDRPWADPDADWAPVRDVHRQDPTDEHLLVAGWNPVGAVLLAEWAGFASPGSTVEIVVDGSVDVAAVGVDGLDPTRITVTAAPDDGVAGLLPLRTEVTTVLFLADDDGGSPDEADARTVLDLHRLKRDIGRRRVGSPRLFVQLLDADNTELVELSGVDDFVISSALGSQLLAQLVDCPERRAVLLELYAPGGVSLDLLCCEDLGLEVAVPFGEVVTRLLAAGLLAIGWRQATGDGGELRLNPPVDEMLHLDPDDEIVVIG